MSYQEAFRFLNRPELYRFSAYRNLTVLLKNYGLDCYLFNDYCIIGKCLSEFEHNLYSVDSSFITIIESKNHIKESLKIMRAKLDSVKIADITGEKVLENPEPFIITDKYMSLLGSF